MVTTKDAHARVKAAGEPDGLAEGQFEAIVSVFGNVDSMGDVVKSGAFTDTLKAWDSKGDQIPVIWSHDWTDPFSHIGSVVKAEERDDGLWVRGELDLDNPKAVQVNRLLRGRRVTQFSYAFDVEDAGFAEKDGEQVFELRRLHLHEVGPCLVGANSETDLLAVKAQALARRAKSEDLPEKYLDRLKDAYAALGEIIEANGDSNDGDAATSDDEDEKADGGHGVKGAIGAGTGPSSTSDEVWDGPGNEANLSNDAGAATYRKAFAWVDPDGDPDKKDSYKFIHHFVSDDGTVGAASTKACVTRIGVLNGGRGGTTIPDGDREGVHAHLAKHLTDAGLDVPELKTPPPDEDGGSQSRTDDAAGATQEAGQPSPSAVANDPASHGGSSAEQPQSARSAQAAARLTLSLAKE